MSAVINREVQLKCLSINCPRQATEGLWCFRHARVGTEFRRPAHEVFANWIDPKRPTG